MLRRWREAAEPSTPPLRQGGNVGGHPELYRIAYEEGKRTVDDQDRELSTIRTRTVQYLAFVATATAFLAGSAITNANHTTSFYALAIAATALAFIAIAITLFVLSPWIVKWAQKISPAELIQEMIELEVPSSPTESTILRKLSFSYDWAYRWNEHQLARVRLAYVVAIAAGAVQLAMWTMIAWIWS